MLLVQFNDGKPAKRCILLVESQTESDEVRRRRWPYYIAFLQDKYECPVLLLVVCSKQETAEWAVQAHIDRPGGPDLHEGLPSRSGAGQRPGCDVTGGGSR